MKYQSGETVSLGDRITYNGQDGCIALIGSEQGSGCLELKRDEWTMNDIQVLILFDNGARLMLDDTSQDDHLVLRQHRN